MAIVSFEIDLNQSSTTWEERMAQLAAIPEVPYDEIDLSEIPELTEERFARMRPFRQVLAELREKRSAT
jgi:hypothetical protein